MGRASESRATLNEAIELINAGEPGKAEEAVTVLQKATRLDPTLERAHRHFRMTHLTSMPK
jgi:Flp pilus assembly protein TadD